MNERKEDPIYNQILEQCKALIVKASIDIKLERHFEQLLYLLDVIDDIKEKK